jgi:hypothetical protein
MFFLSALALSPKILLGFSVAHLLWKDQRVSSFLIKFFAGIPLGFGLSSIPFFFWKLAGWGHAGYMTFELVYVLGIFTALIVLRRDSIKAPIVDLQPASRLERILLAAVLCTLAVALVNFLFGALIRPHGRDDAWWNWNLAARFIFYGKDLGALFDSWGRSMHPGYPFMLSLNVANGWLFLNQATTRVPILISGLFAFCIPGMLFAALAQLRGIKLASIASILILAPWLPEYANFQYADMVVAALILAGCIFFCLYWKTKSPGLMILTGFMTGLSGWTKDEGLPFVVFGFLFFNLAVLFRRDRPASAGNFILGLSPPLLTLGIYKFLFASTSDYLKDPGALLDRILDPARYQVVASHFLSVFSNFGIPDSGGYIWILGIIAVLSGLSFQNWGHKMLGLIFTAQLAAYFMVYILTPFGLQAQLDTSMHRVFSEIVPLLTFLVFSTLKSDQPFLLHAKA